MELLLPLLSSSSETKTLARKSTWTAVSKSQKGSSTALTVGGRREGAFTVVELKLVEASASDRDDSLAFAAAEAFAAFAAALLAAAVAAAVAESGGKPGPATAPFSRPVGESQEVEACHLSNSLLASSTETWKGTTRGWSTPRR